MTIFELRTFIAIFRLLQLCVVGWMKLDSYRLSECKTHDSDAQYFQINSALFKNANKKEIYFKTYFEGWDQEGGPNCTE